MANLVTKSLFCAAALLAAMPAGATGQFQKVGAQTPRFNRTGTQRGLVVPTAGQILMSKAQLHAPRLAADEETPNLFGCVIFDTNYDERPTGLYQFEASADGEWMLLNKDIIATQGAVLAGNTYWVCYQTYDGTFVEDYVDAYDVNTWECLEHLSANGTLHGVGGMAADPATGVIYGCFWGDDGQGCVFGTADFEAGIRTAICPISGTWIGCAFDADGTLYALDYYGDLNKVDKRTGDMTYIGSTGIESMYNPNGVTIDPNTGKMYVTAAPADGRGLLYEVNVSNGVATLIAELPYSAQVTGLCVINEPEEGQPGAIPSLEAQFNDGSLSGALDFRAPYEMADGTTGNGTLEYVLYVNGTEAKTGDMKWGEQVSLPYTVPEAGMYTFLVRPRCNGVLGAGKEATLYVGNDTPLEPVVKVERKGDKNIITWEEAPTGVNMGYVDLEKTTYTIRRMTDNTVVAENYAGTSIEDAVADGDKLVTCTYSVVATFDGRSSNAGISNPLYLGYIVPPFLETFDNEKSLEGWTVIDHNDDTMTWKWLTGGMVRVNYRNNIPMDDYLLTPRVKLEAGKAYRLSCDVNSHKAGTVERIEILLGNKPEVEALTTTLVAPTEIPYTEEFQQLNAVITVPEDGDYYVAFHGISDPGQYYLKLDNVAISEALPTTLPAAVTDMKVTPDYDGLLKAHVQFVAPTLDIAGQPLGSLTKIELKRGSEVVKTFDNPQGLCEFDDEVSEAGRYCYTAVTYGADGEGLSESYTVYVGINKPGMVTNLNIWEEEDGLVGLSWDAPAVDVDGQPINPALVTYTIADVTAGEPLIIEEDVTDTTYAVQAVAPGQQSFVSYAVFAVTKGGMSTGLQSKVLCVGTPYDCPFTESFPMGQLVHPLALTWADPAHKGQWMLLSDEDVEGVLTSADGDGGLIGMTGASIDDEATIWTGKISLEGVADPTLSFQLYNINQGEMDWNFVNVMVECDGQTDDLELYLTPADLGGTEQGWYTANVDLSKYTGKVVRLGITACTQVYQWTFLDDIRVGAATVGVEELTQEHEAVYYDLTGRRVANPAHGIFIKKTGDYVSKVRK